MGTLKTIGMALLGAFVLSTIIRLSGGAQAAAESSGIMILATLFVLWVASKLYSGLASDYVDVAKDEGEDFFD
ncbi:hypothetical protein [Natrinema versiforme]|uniref:Uncharacterized protein n=1 Tax=Natrinema versiforme TaxID=88724 RepID=A0A4P8WK57_9EURY|nr:hypothetical protein [Natrinema versiforme]QCS43898.1 hypothetical protein FEJ81_16660 [Natrinema versiforme]